MQHEQVTGRRGGCARAYTTQCCVECVADGWAEKSILFEFQRIADAFTKRNAPCVRHRTSHVAVFARPVPPCLDAAFRSTRQPTTPHAARYTQYGALPA